MEAADGFDRPIFVSGCQRSGTTLLTTLIASSKTVARSHTGRDEELAGAYVLCGDRRPESSGRYCFQTTYLNDSWQEYLELKSEYKLVWVLRKPECVVYSMVYNWARYPLNELFMSCGASFVQGRDIAAFHRFGLLALSPVKRACYAYVGKCQQFLKLSTEIGSDRLLLVEYGDLVSSPRKALHAISEFLEIDVPIASAYPVIKTSSVDNAAKLLPSDLKTIDEICALSYHSCAQYKLRID